MNRRDFDLVGNIALVWGALVTAYAVVAIAWLLTATPEEGPESAPAGDLGQPEAPGECLDEPEDSRGLVLLRLVVTPDPAADVTADQDAGGCIAPASTLLEGSP